MSQRGPRDLLNFTARKQLKETELLVVDPKIPRLVLNNGKHTPAAGNAAYRIEAVILQVADAAKRSDPDSPAIILKERMRSMSIEVAVGCAGAGNRNLPVIPSVQAARSCEPNASVPVCQNSPYVVIRQALFCSEGRDGKIAKAVEAIFGSHPDTAFTILEDCVNAFAREAVRLRKQIGSSLVFVYQA